MLPPVSFPIIYDGEDKIGASFAVKKSKSLYYVSYVMIIPSYDFVSNASIFVDKIIEDLHGFNIYGYISKRHPWRSTFTQISGIIYEKLTQEFVNEQNDTYFDIETFDKIVFDRSQHLKYL